MQATIPSSIPVRRAAPSDLDALVALEQSAFDSDRLSRAQYRRHLTSDSALILVADAFGHSLAGAAVVFFRRGSTVARLYSLATAPEARGKGIATALLDAAGAAACRRGCRTLRLEVRADNAVAIHLYERHGYHRMGRLAAYYDDGADGWRYAQPLGIHTAEAE